MVTLSLRFLTGAALLGLFVQSGCGEPPTIVYEPLRVINWTPQRGAVCIDPAQNLVIEATFSKDLVPETLSNETFTLRDLIESSDVAATIDYAGLTKTASLLLADDLAPDTEYSLVVTTEVQDGTGGTLPTDLAASFRTRPDQGECIQ